MRVLAALEHLTRGESRCPETKSFRKCLSEAEEVLALEAFHFSSARFRVPRLFLKVGHWSLRLGPDFVHSAQRNAPSKSGGGSRSSRATSTGHPGRICPSTLCPQCVCPHAVFLCATFRLVFFLRGRGADSSSQLLRAAFSKPSRILLNVFRRSAARDSRSRPQQRRSAS